VAKKVRDMAIFVRFYLREDASALRNLVKFVLLPLRFLMFKLSDACTELSFPAFA